MTTVSNIVSGFTFKQQAQGISLSGAEYTETSTDAEGITTATLNRNYAYIDKAAQVIFISGYKVCFAMLFCWHVLESKFAAGLRYSGFLMEL